MNLRFAIDRREGAAAITIAAVMGIWFFALLSVLAKPHAMAKSVAQANTQMDGVEAVYRRPGQAFAYPLGAVCKGQADPAAQAMRQRLGAAAVSAGVTLDTVLISPGAPDRTTGWLTPVSLRVEAEGPYGAVLGFMNGLARSKPQIFVSTADFRTKTTQVALSLDGLFYCSTYARP